MLHPNTLDRLQADLLQSALAFLPELILCFTIVLMLLLRLVRGFTRVHLGGLALALTLLMFCTAWQQWNETPTNLIESVAHLFSTGRYYNVELLTGGDLPATKPIFTDMLVYDALTVYLRLFLFGFTALIIWLSLLTGIPDSDDSADFYCLLLGATLGMSIMVSANHLLMVYMGIEMASVPSYALAGFLKGRRQSGEAALKYVVYGGASSGVMLFGISLLVGKYGTGYLPNVAAGVVSTLHTLHTPGQVPPVGFDPILLLALMFLLIGIAFKLAAVPFHFWCPDVFEGAAAEVAAFLSVASKGAALALLARFSLLLVGLMEVTDRGLDFEDWRHVVWYLAPSLAVFAVLTATFGNLAAYLQTNLKRLLAYSTIAHAGYMMMGLATLTRDGAAAVLFYLMAYLFMNLGAFAVVAFLRNQTGSEDLTSFRGLVQRSPLMVITLAVFLLSLLGLPPLVGFAAKFQIFSALYHAGQHYGSVKEPGLSNTMYLLLLLGGLNTVISAVYYLKVLKVMILDKPLEEVEGLVPSRLAVPFGSALYATLVALVVFLGGIFWGPLAIASGVKEGATSQLRKKLPAKPAEKPKTKGGPRKA